MADRWEESAKRVAAQPQAVDRWAQSEQRVAQQQSNDPWERSAARVKDNKKSGFVQEFLKGIPRTFLNIGEGALGTLEAGMRAKVTGPSYGKPAGYGNPTADKLQQAGENIEAAGAKFAKGGEGFAAWAGGVLGEAVPYVALSMATGGAASIAGGSAKAVGAVRGATAAGAAFFAEGEQAYDDAIAGGATEEGAQLERAISGGIVGIIEAAQVGNILKFGKAGKTSIRNIMRMAKARAWKALKGEGKQLGGMLLKSSIEGALEEALQEGGVMIAPAVLRGDYPTNEDGSVAWVDIASRIGQAAAAGGFAAGVIGGGGALTGMGEGARPGGEAIKASAERVNTSNLSAVEKGRALDALNNLGTKDPGIVELDEQPDITIPTEVQETLDAAQKVESTLSDLDIDPQMEKEAISEERSKRFAEFESILQGEPDPVIAAALAYSAIEGDLKLTFTPLEQQFNPEDMAKLYDAVRQSNLMTGQKLSVYDMLNTVFKEGKLPQKAQMKMFDQLFGTTLGTTMDRKLLTKSGKVRRHMADVMNVPRAMLASMDFSASARQGLLLMPMSPKNWAKATYAGYRAALSPEYSEFIDLEMRSNPYYNKFTGLGGHYAQEGMGAAGNEEAYASRFVDKIPGIAASERAYRTTLNMLRLYNFSKIAKQWEGTSKNTKDYKKLVSFINHATGRGDLPKFMKKYSEEMNWMFFAPRMHFGIAQTWTDGFKGSKEARKIIAGTMAKALGSGLAVLGLAALAGVDIEGDPRSADFGLIRIGDTRINFWGAHQSLARMMVQSMMGEKKSTTTGMLYDKKRVEVLTDYLRTKMNAAPSLVLDLSRGYNMFGERIQPTVEGRGEVLLKSFTPLVWQDMYEAYQYNGMSQAAIIAPLAMHGIGAMTYQNNEASKSSGLKNTYAREYFGVGWNEIGPEAQKSIRAVHPDVEQQEQRAKIEQLDYVSDAKFAEESRQSALRIRKHLSANTRKILSENYIPVPGVGRVLGTNWTITSDRAKAYELETAKMINEYLPKVVSSAYFKPLNKIGQQQVIDKLIKQIKSKVRKDIMNQANMKDMERRQVMEMNNGTQ